MGYRIPPIDAIGAYFHTSAVGRQDTDTSILIAFRDKCLLSSLLKHARRVRLGFGLAPYQGVPNVRSEHAAPIDVELARRQRGIDVEPKLKADGVTVADAKPKRAVQVATDGGVVLKDPDTDEDDESEESESASSSPKTPATSDGVTEPRAQNGVTQGRSLHKVRSLIYAECNRKA